MGSEMCIRDSNKVLRERNDQLNQYQTRCQEFEIKFSRFESESKDFHRRLELESNEKEDLFRKNSELQRRVGELGQVSHKIA